MENKDIRALADQLAKEMTDAGKLIEGGWRAYDMMILPKDEEVLKRECRLAFMAGAQHLFASIMTVLDADREPTAQDMRRMDLIHRELEAIKPELELRARRTEGSA